MVFNIMLKPRQTDQKRKKSHMHMGARPLTENTSSPPVTFRIPPPHTLCNFLDDPPHIQGMSINEVMLGRITIRWEGGTVGSPRGVGGWWHMTQTPSLGQ